MLERNDWFGGAIKTAEITEPGFKHDVFSAWHPLWVGGAAHAELGAELARHGLEYLNTDLPTATLYPDGESAFLLRTADANAAELDRHHAGDGDAWRAMLGEFFPNADLAFGVLGTELWSRPGRRPRREGLPAARPSGRCGIRRPPARLEPGTGWRRRSSRSGRTACSRRGCCTPASVRTRRPPATWPR